ncbi:MAG: hypothetical protein LBT96_03395 [Campylobacteraceae bacterium]|jgi:hypothetical protein|nr:hypothetical protein [Campylobacteraceae bacterium]
MDEIEFELKNGKLYIAIAVFVFLFLIGLWVLLHSNSPSLDINPILVKVSSSVSLVFSAAVIYICAKTALSKRAGLIINKYGITDKASLLSLGFISEKNIKKVKVGKAEHRYYLFVELLDKEKYLNAENDYISNILKSNIKKYDCEIAIPLSNLKCSASEIQNALELFFGKNYK